MNLYCYRALVRSIYDGDTVRLDIDLGLSTWILNKSIRLYGIDTPEIRGKERPEGLKSREALEAMIPVGTEITIETYLDKSGKYGRLLATIWKGDVNVNDWLIKEGHADKY